MNIIVLRRRLFYICAMVALLVPLYVLGNPSVRNQDGSVKQSGGTLAQLRTQYDLGQGDLGEIDPASESMRLATLGLRGVAATVLWQKAEYYKKEQYWDSLSATLNQIAILQPHFIKVWEFQSHNLSYNVSAEFDDYRQRYQWVKRGMDYLVKGSKFNKRRTELPYELGWFFGNKFGVADEKKQFREMYRADDVFHADIRTKSGLDLTTADGLGPDRKPDNWLSGRLWYERAYQMVEGGSPPARSIMMFYRMSPQWLMKYSEGVQGDGVLDEAARYAWRTAGREWERFGERQILTTFGDTIYLTELDVANREFEKNREEFHAFCGATYDRMLAERATQLTPEEIAAKSKDYVDRSFDEALLAESALSKLSLASTDIARETPDNIRVEALQKAKALDALNAKIQHIEVYRNQINYGYWTERCIAEQQDAALAARINMYDANELLERGELDSALEKFEIAWRNWEALFNRHPTMMIDDAADEVLASVERYRKLLDEPTLPEDFGLAKLIKFREYYDNNMVDDGMMNLLSSWNKLYPERDFLDEMIRRSEAISMSFEENAAETADPAESNSPEPSREAVDEAPPSQPNQATGTPETAAAVTDNENPLVVEDAKVDNASQPSLKVDPPEPGSAPSPIAPAK